MRFLISILALFFITQNVSAQCSFSITPVGPINLCQGNSVTLTADTGLQYQWYISQDDVTFAIILGATNSSFTTPVDSGIFYYEVLANWSCTSNVVTITTNGLPTITATLNTGACSNYDTLNASGGNTYSWSPAMGLSCTNCSDPVANPSVSTTYTVIGQDNSGCTDTTTINVLADKIWGNINFNNTMPDTTDAKVWLIVYDSVTQMLTAVDSVNTCNDNGSPYFEFNGEPTGNYLLKAKLLYGNYAGSSGYIPTYHDTSLYWYNASNISYTGNTIGNNNITMQYGTVPSGPGFIAGNVLTGANKSTGTTGGIPAVGMMIYLRNAANSILTYTYTDVNGNYTFSNIANGTYSIYPEAINYTTTPYTSIAVNNGQVSNINFKQNTTDLTIEPITTGINNISATTSVGIYPNPTTGNISISWQQATKQSAHIIVTDAIGREVYNTNLIISTGNGSSKLNLSQLQNGIYTVQLRSADINYVQKLVIEK